MNDATCCVDGCSRPIGIKKHQMCRKHYQRAWAGIPVEDHHWVCKWRSCSSGVAIADGYCNKHRQIIRRRIEGAKPKGRRVQCKIDGCTDSAPRNETQLCRFHYQRQYLGIPFDKPRRAARGTRGWQDPEWGRCWHDPNGYVLTSNGSRPIQVHRLVMQRALGRQLFADENVHHINGVRDDNRLENLELWSTSQPAGQRVDDKIAWAREILARYGEDGNTNQLRLVI